MLYISRDTKRKIVLSMLAVLAAFLQDILPNALGMRYIGTILYSFLLILWAMSVQYRIPDPGIRRYMAAAAVLLLSLFVLRLCRWSLFAWSAAADAFLWDILYIPFTGVPVFALFAAACVGTGTDKRPVRRIRWVWWIWALVCVCVLTNGWHGQLLNRTDTGHVEYGWMYYVVVLWCAALSLAYFLVLLRRCRLSGTRDLWYIPVAAAVFGVFLISAYYLCGGSPSIGGIKLYHLHEAYAALYVGLWESCIQIGLLPSHSDYPELFGMAGLHASIYWTPKERRYTYPMRQRRRGRRPPAAARQERPSMFPGGRLSAEARSGMWRITRISNG